LKQFEKNISDFKKIVITVIDLRQIIEYRFKLKIKGQKQKKYLVLVLRVRFKAKH